MANSLVRRHLLDSFTRDLQKPIRGHIVELDSLRGVAALIVVFDHFTRLWREASPSTSLRYISHLPFLENGRSAVIMFFVLSGFVLTMPMLAGKGQVYPVYAVRRICRIYLPYVVPEILDRAPTRHQVHDQRDHGEEQQ
jgi:peptidoglycan/LPS O-acetylase OafA/YrhL